MVSSEVITVMTCGLDEEALAQVLRGATKGYIFNRAGIFFTTCKVCWKDRHIKFNGYKPTLSFRAGIPLLEYTITRIFSG